MKGIEVSGRKIIIEGVGRMFYQDGVPISVIVGRFKQKGIEVSMLHVADECLKNGWSPKTTFNKLSEDFGDDKSLVFDKKLLEEFCFASYEQQRSMIHDYLQIDKTFIK